MKKRWNRGITLVETMVACGVITTLMLGTIPPSVKMLQQKLTETTAQEIIAIQEAEKNYWIDKLNTNGVGQWASSITILKNEGYLPSKWDGKNLWKNDYKVITTTSTCEVQTTIPKGLEGVIQTRCPQVNVSSSGANSIVSSTIPVPGQEPTMEALLHRTGDTRFRTAEEPISVKKYLVVGDDLTNVDTKNVEGGNLYSKALKTKGVSKTGWLSDAKFKPKGRYREDSKSISMVKSYTGGEWKPVSVAACIPGGSDSVLTKTSGSIKITVRELWYNGVRHQGVTAEYYVSGNTPPTEVIAPGTGPHWLPILGEISAQATDDASYVV
ncbi:MAG TPA: hypothetical protein P5150_09540, partial [Candidatus Ratteibacteria bacterium]|nr:hypothetical protein [Candidatus Ratteibacteria bacterium]